MKTIVTHDGGFHADEVCAIAMLDIYFNKHSIEYSITRTREKESIESADYVLDVGGQYDPEHNRFDHHQPGGAGKHPDTQIDYATCGLIWKTFGMEICSGNTHAWHMIEERICIPIDAHDNGITLRKSIEKYEPLTLGEIISFFNKFEIEDNDHYFHSAVQATKTILENVIDDAAYHLKCEIVAREAVENAGNSPIVMIDEYVGIYHELINYPHVNIFIYPKQGTWRAKAVRKSHEGFEPRVSFPSTWAGLRDSELEKASGIKDLTFAHRGLFYVVGLTKESILEAIKYAK